MARYYISDCHFWHKNLLDQMDKRGFESVEEMNEYMIQQWNNKVRKKKDEVIILGDFGFMNGKQANELLDRLNGKKYLIIGNHDRLFLRDKDFDPSKFEWIKDYAELNDNKRHVVLSHYPMLSHNGQYRKDSSGKPKTYMLYGHVHDTVESMWIDRFTDILSSNYNTEHDGSRVLIPCNMINTFCGYSDYMPMTLDEWIEITEERKRIRKEKGLSDESGQFKLYRREKKMSYSEKNFSDEKLMFLQADFCIEAYENIIDVLRREREKLKQDSAQFALTGTEKGLEISREIMDDMVRMTADIAKWEKAIDEASYTRAQAKRLMQEKQNE